MTNLIEVRVQVDEKVYSVQLVGDASDAALAYRIGQGVAVAIMKHGEDDD